MGYIPSGAQWYVAEIVQEITVEGDLRNVVHKNLLLIRTDSPEDAYEKALVLGHEGEVSYSNLAGQQVRIKFRGLSELNVIHDELNHGTELLYEEHFSVAAEQIEEWVLPKDRLTIFRPIGPHKSPDYSDRKIVQEANHLCRNPSD